MSNKVNRMYRQNQQSSYRQNQWNQGGGFGSGLMGNYSEMGGNNMSMAMMANMQRMNSQNLMNNQNMAALQNMAGGMSNYSNPPSLMNMNFSSDSQNMDMSSQMSSSMNKVNLFSNNSQSSLLGNFNPRLSNVSPRFSNRKSDYSQNLNKRMRMDQGRDWNLQRNRMGNNNRGGTANRGRQSTIRSKNSRGQNYSKDEASPKDDNEDSFIYWSLFDDSDKDDDDDFSDDNIQDKYDPASPTEDVPQERLKRKYPSENLRKNPSPQNSGDLQVTIKPGRLGRAVNKDNFQSKTQNAAGSTQTFRCHACHVPCGNQASFFKHLQSDAHQMVMDKISQQYDQTAKQMEARLKAEEHLRKIEGTGRRKDMWGSEKANYCTVCQVRFTDSLINHRRTKDHKRQREHLYPGCRKCHIKRFPSRDAYEIHCKSDNHLKNCDDWHQKMGSSSHGSQDEDSQFDPSDFVTVDATGIFEEELSDAREDDNAEEQSMDQDEKAGENISSFPDYNSNTPIGQEVVIAVTGFFCRLCHKFYKEEESAKLNHCQSRTHYENFKEYKIFKTQQKKTIPKAVKHARNEEMFKNGVTEVLTPSLTSCTDGDENVAVNVNTGIMAVQSLESSEDPVVENIVDVNLDISNLAESVNLDTEILDELKNSNSPKSVNLEEEILDEVNNSILAESVNLETELSDEVENFTLAKSVNLEMEISDELEN